MKHYSFYIGVPGTKKSNWLYMDIKLPARSVKEAITLQAFQDQYHYKYGKNFSVPGFLFREPSSKYVFLKYRLILEFERCLYDRRRKLRHSYRKTAEYPVHRIKHLFRDDDLEEREIKKTLATIQRQLRMF